MKVSRSLPAGLALAALLALPAAAQSRPTAEAQESQVGQPRWTIATVGVDGKTEVREFDGPEIPADGQGVLTQGLMVATGVPVPDDAARLSAAADILKERGFAEEAERLREIAAEVRRKDSSERIEARAAELLEGDITDKAVRVAMLDVVADGFWVAGWETSEAAMRWFAAVGRTQLPGAAPDVAIPDPPQLEEGNVTMGRLIEIVRRGAGVQAELGNENAARMCERLATFYVERGQSRAAAADEPAEEPEAEPAPTERRGIAPQPLRGLGYGSAPDRTRDLTYIEGRVPVLKLARNAYGLEGGDLTAEERELGLAWMNWMVASGQNRVQDEQVEMPPLPGAVSMEGIIDTIRRAGDIYDANRRKRDGDRCRALADYYVKRDRGEVDDNSATPPRKARVRPGVAADPTQAGIDERRRALEEQIRALEEQIEALQKEIERRRSKGGGGRR